MGTGGQTRYRNAAHSAAQHGQKRRLAVIAFNIHVCCRIMLRRCHFVGGGAILAGADRNFNAKFLHRVCGQVHIAAAFKGSAHLNGAGGFHQRGGKQQPADELAGHIARQRKGTGAQAAKNRNALFVLFKTQPLALKQLGINFLRALHQAACAGKAHFLGRQAEQRQDKPQCAAAFVAEHRAGNGGKTVRIAAAGNGQLMLALLHLGPQLLGSPQRGQNILRKFHIANVAGTGGQGRAHHSAVCRAFAGRHGSGSGQAARFNGCNGCFHGVPLFRAVQASNVVSNACTAVSTVFSRRPVLSTAASDAAR